MPETLQKRISIAQLKRATAIRENIEELEKELASLPGMAEQTALTNLPLTGEQQTGLPLDSLRFASVRPVFLMSIAAEQYATDCSAFAHLVSGKSWITKLMHIPESSDASFSLFTPKRDEKQYPYNPSPEKTPIEANYFDNHPSIVFDVGIPPLKHTEAFRVAGVTIRVFESGAISARCIMLPNSTARSLSAEEAVGLLRIARQTARDVLHSTLSRFTAHWNLAFPLCQLALPVDTRSTLIAHYYEFIDFDLDAPNPLSRAFSDNPNMDYLRDLYAFCSMGKPYARKHESDQTLRSFSKRNLGGRNDELWYASSTRFVRSFPNRDVPETTAFFEDLLFAIEVLIGLRVSYSAILEETRDRIARLADKFNTFSTDAKQTHDEMKAFQGDICLSAYQLSRCQYPPLIRLYSTTPFSQTVINAVEGAMQLHTLTSALAVELQKMQNLLDSFRTLHSEANNLRLQQLVVRLTMVLGVIGVTLSIGQVIVGFAALGLSKPHEAELLRGAASLNVSNARSGVNLNRDSLLRTNRSEPLSPATTPP